MINNSYYVFEFFAKRSLSLALKLFLVNIKEVRITEVKNNLLQITIYCLKLTSVFMKTIL